MRRAAWARSTEAGRISAPAKRKRLALGRADPRRLLILDEEVERRAAEAGRLHFTGRAKEHGFLPAEEAEQPLGGWARLRHVRNRPFYPSLAALGAGGGVPEQAKWTRA